MITPKYTGFYKPGLEVKAAKLSLRKASLGAEESISAVRPVRIAEDRAFRTEAGADEDDRRPARAA